MKYATYAEKIIGNDPSKFDAIEVHGIQICPETKTETHEQNDLAPDYFSVFLHLKVEGGIECIADIDTLEKAYKYASKIANQYGYRY